MHSTAFCTHRGIFRCRPPLRAGRPAVVAPRQAAPRRSSLRASRHAQTAPACRSPPRRTVVATRTSAPQQVKQLLTSTDLELRIDVRHLRLHRAWRQPKLALDERVRAPLHKQDKHLGLAGR